MSHMDAFAQRDAHDNELQTKPRLFLFLDHVATELVKHVQFMKHDGNNLPTATHMVPSNSQCKRKETMDLSREV